MDWVGLDYDEGPIRQTDRLARYREVAQSMLAKGTAYRCYCSREELDAMRAEQVARGENPRYDGRCRDRKSPVPGVEPVIRLRSPTEGTVTVHDLVRGDVEFRNADLDDLDPAAIGRRADLSFRRGRRRRATWPSPTSSAATITSPTRHVTSTSCGRWTCRCRPSRTCR